MNIKRSDLTQKYEIIRNIGKELVTKMVSSLAITTVHQGAKQLGLMNKDRIVFSNQHEMKILADYVLYHCRVDGQNMIEAYLQANVDTLLPDRIELLSILQNARFCVLEVLDIPSFPILVVKDLIRQDEFLLVDKALSTSAQKNTIIVSNIAFFDDFAMTTGGPIPLVDPNLSDKIRQKVKRHGKQPLEKLIVSVLKTCLAEDALAQVVYC